MNNEALPESREQRVGSIELRWKIGNKVRRRACKKMIPHNHNLALILADAWELLGGTEDHDGDGSVFNDGTDDHLQIEIEVPVTLHGCPDVVVQI